MTQTIISSILFLFLLATASTHGTIIYVPDDQSTIQAGIDAASNGDTVIVDAGTYTENINFTGKNIVVGSLFLTTGDTSYVSLTVIDGNGMGPVVNISNGEDSTATLVGFTITNGNAWLSGGGISCEGSAPKLLHLHIKANDAYYYGGGIYCRKAHPRLENLRITDNLSRHEGGGVFCVESKPHLKNVILSSNNTFYYGGGLACWDSNPFLEKVSIIKNMAMDKGGGVYFSNSHPEFHRTNRCNIYLNYAAKAGNDLYASDTSLVSIIVDTLTVLNPDDIYLYAVGMFDLDALHVRVEQVAADLYVSPAGNDNNTGLTPAQPLRTLNLALHKITADSLNPRTIFIANGRYSPTTGEFFPLKMKSFVTLSGTSRDGTILDAQGQEEDLFSQNGVLHIDGTSWTWIENMTITGGFSISSLSQGGGGIYCSRSDPHLVNLLITGNRSSDGGGLYFTQSTPYLTQITITENYGHSGGGIFCTETHPVFKRVTVGSNSARTGGGISISSTSDGTLEEVTIKKNEAEHSGGGLVCNMSAFDMKNCTITTNTAGWGGGGIYCRLSTPYFERVVITRNEAPHGGGLFCTQAEPYLVNVTLSMNEASHGGAVVCADGSHPTLVNSILWNDDPQEISFYEYSDKNALTVYYSDVQHGSEGIVTNNNGMVYLMARNINADPIFTAPQNDNFDLDIASPCIDKGIQDTVLVYFIWSAPETVSVPALSFIGRAPNMGAFENEPGCPGGEIGDVNGDREMNVLDVVFAVNHIMGLFILDEHEGCRANCNRDAYINIRDVTGIVSLIVTTGTCEP